MFKTPAIPAEIAQLKAPRGFLNPLKSGVVGPNLFGTETLCGDWNGDLLLLAQDFAPAAAFKTVLKKYGAELAWRHNDGDGRYRVGKDTNPAICRLLRSIGRDVEPSGSNATSCGVLYANALFFLKAGGALEEGIAASQPVFDFVAREMKGLRVIACLGKASFEGAMRFLGSSADWVSHRYAQSPVVAGKFLVFGLAHPGYWGSYQRLPSGNKEERFDAMKGDWASMARSALQQLL
jgi:hypothetical protein